MTWAGGERILLVEDDADLARAVQEYLSRLNYQVLWAADGGSGLKMALERHPDLVLLDIGLPVMDGYEVCQRLRAASDVVIMFLTSANSEEDIVRGLYHGADSYMSKPFGLAVLAARIKAVLRRRGRQQQRGWAAVYDDGVLYIDTEHGTVRKRGQDVSLTLKERQLLLYLVQHAEEVVRHSELLQVAWGAEYKGAKNYLSLYMRYLRLKIEDDPDQPRYLVTRFGLGYFFAPSQEGNYSQ